MNPYNNYNMGMNNFYPNQFSTLTQPQMTTQNLIRVNGIDGAKAYQMSANSTVALFDTNEDIMYVKSTDGAPVQGATAIATATAAGDIVTLPISALVRLNCDCDTANLTIVIGGQVVTAQNLALVVEKE